MDLTTKVLVLMPHPDDEAVFCSGLFQFLNRLNIPIKVIIFTKGEASALRFGLKAKQSLASARVKEQEKAFRILQIKNYTIANISDGDIESCEQKVKLIIQKEISTYKPTHLLTLEPDGIYGHPDHVALSKFTTQICKPPLKLLYTTVCPNFILPRAKHMAKISKIKPITPQFQLNLSFSDIIIKLKALNAHGSQFRNIWHMLGTGYLFIRNKMLIREYFSYYGKK